MDDREHHDLENDDGGVEQSEPRRGKNYTSANQAHVTPSTKIQRPKLGAWQSVKPRSIANAHPVQTLFALIRERIEFGNRREVLRDSLGPHACGTAPHGLSEG